MVRDVLSGSGCVGEMHVLPLSEEHVCFLSEFRAKILQGRVWGRPLAKILRDRAFSVRSWTFSSCFYTVVQTGLGRTHEGGGLLNRR